MGSTSYTLAAHESPADTPGQPCTVPGTFEKDCLDKMWKAVGCTTDIVKAHEDRAGKYESSKTFAERQKAWNKYTREEVSEKMKLWTTTTNRQEFILCYGWCNVPGTYDDACLKAMWRKAGCKTDVVEAFRKRDGSFFRQKDRWNERGISIVLSDMLDWRAKTGHDRVTCHGPPAPSPAPSRPSRPNFVPCPAPGISPYAPPSSCTIM